MSRKAIFVLQDEPAARRDIGVYLRAAGWVVEEFESATDCFLRAMEAPPGCIVSNLPVPGMACDEFIESLRGMGCGSPVLVVTAETCNEAHRAARAAGVCEVIDRRSFSPRLRYVLSQLLA